MGKVVWTPENDRKLLIRLIEKSAKAYDTEHLRELFPGATAKAIEERIAKLKREAKSLGEQDGVVLANNDGKNSRVGGVKRTGSSSRGGSSCGGVGSKRSRKDAAMDDEEEKEKEKAK